MAQPNRITISGAVEGDVDEAVLRRLLLQVGANQGTIHGKQGKPFLLKRLDGYNRAAQFTPWAVLVDLDHDADCAPPFCRNWLPNPSPYMCFRVVVREIESWLFADRERLARFLGVRASLIPEQPETVECPKRTMIEVANASRRREIREDMVPRPGSRRKIGPAYNSRLIEFVGNVERGWRPHVAANVSESVKRCLRGLQRLITA